MQITSPDPILGTYIAHNPWLWLAWHIFLFHECAVLSFYACVLDSHLSTGMNVELYNFTYLTFFPKYLCHLLMQVSLLLAFPIKLFIKSTPIILSRLLQTFLNSNWIRGTWHQKFLFSSKRDAYSAAPREVGIDPKWVWPSQKYPKIPMIRRCRTILLQKRCLFPGASQRLSSAASPRSYPRLLTSPLAASALLSSRVTKTPRQCYCWPVSAIFFGAGVDFSRLTLILWVLR